ncbi:MAG: uroporphyrinogen decarboxylase family protein [Candidatus Merdivicinus sp.]|jgi:uroporphyrinogen decarboxylase
MKIQKAPETMSARERVIRTFQYEKTDRVTIGYGANPGIQKRLMTELGVSTSEELFQALGVDYRGIHAPYIGPQLFQVPEGREVNQLEGCIMRKVEHATGYYWDFCDFPLQDADAEAFETFPIPNPDHFDYDAALEQAKSYGGQYGLYVGGAGIPDIINSNGRLMGMEDVLCHLISEDEAALNFIHRRAEFQLGMLERTLDKCRGYIDFLWLGEDLGTQIGPMISLDLYRKIFRPIHKLFADLAASYHIPSIIHTCGSSSWAYEDFIEIGIKGVDTLQPEAANMSPAYLAEHFGGRLNFRGCISTAGPLAYGTPEEVRENCRETLEIMMKCRGYHFAPTHSIQDNSPTENVVAMYQAAHDLGRYR